PPKGLYLYYTIVRNFIVLFSIAYPLDPFENSLFLFCGGKKDRIKALLWEGDGFLLMYKRLENGAFQWPRTSDEVREITPQQFRWLIEGLSIDQKKVIRKIENKVII